MHVCVVCSEELGRPENKDLKSFVDKLAGAKQVIDDKGKTAGQSICRESAQHCTCHQASSFCTADVQQLLML